MANGLPWYPRRPRDLFEGTAGMSIKLKGPYGLLLDLIYIHDGALPDNRQYIAGHLGMGVRGLGLVIPELVALGKLVIENNIISNPKADEVLAETRGKKSDPKIISRSSEDDLKMISTSSSDHLEITEILVNENNPLAQAREIENQNHKEDHAHDDDGPTLREKLLVAMGVPPSGLTGRGGNMLGTQADMAEAEAWLRLPGLSESSVLLEVEAIVLRKGDGPPSNFRYFTGAMRKLSGALSAPALEPEGVGNGQRSGRPRSGRDAGTLNRIIGLATGEG